MGRTRDSIQTEVSLFALELVAHASGDSGGSLRSSFYSGVDRLRYGCSSLPFCPFPTESHNTAPLPRDKQLIRPSLKSVEDTGSFRQSCILIRQSRFSPRRSAVHVVCQSFFLTSNVEPVRIDLYPTGVLYNARPRKSILINTQVIQ